MDLDFFGKETIIERSTDLQNGVLFVDQRTKAD
jgi:hypothetical protein